MTTTIETPPAADARLLVTVEEAMRLLSIKRNTLYTLLNSGAIKSVKLGGARRIVVASLQAYIEQEQQ